MRKLNHILSFVSLLLHMTKPSVATDTARARGTSIRNSPQLSNIVHDWGYPIVESHKVRTQDGYILTLQRIPKGYNAECDTAKRSNRVKEKQKVDRCTKKILKETEFAGSPIKPVMRLTDDSMNSVVEETIQPEIPMAPMTEATVPLKKPVVLLYHGLLTCSELFVCHPAGREKNLALILADAGYDVWLGNNRGNRYSMEHDKYDTEDKEFWDFGIGEIAQYDIPAVVEYILKETTQPSLAYIGYSQGTAQCLAALSMNESLNQKIHLFIGLAVAMKPERPENSILNHIMNKYSPSALYKIFGRRSLFGPLVARVRSVVPAGVYVKLIDSSIGVLFGWDTSHLSTETKKAVYSRLYSSGSVRNVVHWFEIITSETFRPDIGFERKEDQLEDEDTLNEKVSDEPNISDSPKSEPLTRRRRLLNVCRICKSDDRPAKPKPEEEEISDDYETIWDHLTIRGKKKTKENKEKEKEKDEEILPTQNYVCRICISDDRPAKPKPEEDEISDDYETIWDHLTIRGKKKTKENKEKGKGKEKEKEEEILVNPYPTLKISTPLALFCGEADNISDQDFIKRTLPSPLYFFKSVPLYGHLDFLWRDGVDQVVYKDVLTLLKEKQPTSDK